MNSSETIRSLAYILPILLVHQVIWKGVYCDMHDFYIRYELAYFIHTIFPVCFQAFCLSIVNVPNAFLASFPGFPGK